MKWTKVTIAVAVVAALFLTVGASFLINHFYSLHDPAGQIARWKLNDSSGTTVEDSSLPSHSGKIIGDGFQWVQGWNGDALRFDGRQYVLLGNIYQGSYDQISIACWIRKPFGYRTANNWQSIVERSSWDNPDGIGLWADYSGSGASFGHYLSGYARSTATVQDNHWHHLVGTMAKSPEGYIYSIYVDGKLDNTITNAVGLTSTTRPWTIGGRYDGTWRYSGLVSDVRIFDRALTPDEVRRIYNQ